MRFVSKYGRFGVPVRRHEEERYANGVVRVIQQGITAYFDPNKLRPLEREMAVKRWAFNGSMQEADEATTYPPDYRIGVYDTDEAQQDWGWDEDTRDEVERFLLDYADRHEGWVFAVRSLVPPPWPNYDDFRGTPQALVRRLVEDGYDLETVLAYERDHQKRPKTIEEIEKAIANPPAPELEEEIVG
jgi:hypothetical protein